MPSAIDPTEHDQIVQNDRENVFSLDDVSELSTNSSALDEYQTLSNV